MNIVRPAAAGTLESSDALVTVEPAPQVKIAVSSPVQKQFGEAIKRAVCETLQELNVNGAAVTVQDRGALECTLRARVETAVRRAGEVG